jgi:serine/threonine protein phosphatase PrpC
LLNELIIVAALLVLTIVGVLILRELRLARLASSTNVKGRRGDSVPVPQENEDDPDVTKVARQPPLPVIDAGGNEATEESTPSTAATFFEEGAEVDEPTGSKKMFVVWAAGQSDRGKVRRRNEDSILLLGESSVFVVADGMGGYAGGDVASKIAVDTIAKAFRSAPAPSSSRAGGPASAPRPLRGNELVVAMEAANDAIRAEARRRSEYGKMGATIVGARFVERKQRAFIGHIGDSRCYRLRGGELRLLTRDHTMAAKGVPGPMGEHVRRALGVAPSVQVDLLVDKPQASDVYVLCSDGLNKMVDDTRIAEILRAHLDDLDAAVRILIQKANDSGGRDNVSVVLVGIRPAVSSPKVA